MCIIYFSTAAFKKMVGALTAVFGSDVLKSKTACYLLLPT